MIVFQFLNYYGQGYSCFHRHTITGRALSTAVVRMWYTIIVSCRLAYSNITSASVMRNTPGIPLFVYFYYKINIIVGLACFLKQYVHVVLCR